MGHRAEAEVWPSPWEEHVGRQLGCLVLWSRDRQVGQTRIFEQVGSFLRWECLRQVVQYLGTMWM